MKMKLKKEMLTHNMDGSQVMVSTDKEVFSGIITSNKTAADIVDLLREETTPDEIKKAMAEKYDAPYEVISKDVDMILDKLISVGVVEP